MKTISKKKKGISLIVLVITIIVMIILAAAVILSLSSNGVIDRANEAVSKTDEKQVQALASTIWADAFLEYREGKITDIEAKVVEDLEETLEIENIAEIYNVEVTLKGVAVSKWTEEQLKLPVEWRKNVTKLTEDGVPIPKGFVISPYEGENTKAEGLVIYEKLSTDTSNDIAAIDGSHQNSLEKRNQYVWVPVDKNTFETTFVRRDFTTTATTNTLVLNEDSKYYALGTSKKFWEVTPTTDETDETNKDFIEISETPPSKTIKEVQEMYASVKEYGGFYIARYEAGLGTDPTVPNVHRKSRGTATNLPTGHDNVHFKMGQIPYTYIPWTWNNSMKEESNGVVSVARSLYPNNLTNTTGVISTLTYGVQWDTTVQWFKTNGKYGDENTAVPDVTDSIVYGNYYDHKIDKGDLNPGAKYATEDAANYTLGAYKNVTYTDGESQAEKNTSTSWALSTGALKVAKINNIYDMAGNMLEWTMEGYSTNCHCSRGGYFRYGGSMFALTSRFAYPIVQAYYDLSFRPSLYIKR